MAKSENENVYFPHFVSARNDRKIRRLRKELGVEGYGIFFMLLEVLREQSDMRYPMEDLDLLAEEFGTSEQKIRVSICNYGLFVVDSDEFFFSPKQIEYLKPYLAKSKRAKHAALVRWHGDNANADANALPEQSKCNANAMQGEERRGEESREEERKERKERTTFPLFWKSYSTVLPTTEPSSHVHGEYSPMPPSPALKNLILAMCQYIGDMGKGHAKWYYKKLSERNWHTHEGDKMSIEKMFDDIQYHYSRGWMEVSK